MQDVLHFTYEDGVFPVKGADCIRAITEKEWKYAVYYDPFTGAPTEYQIYDLKRDPLEMMNLAHATHALRPPLPSEFGSTVDSRTLCESTARRLMRFAGRAWTTSNRRRESRRAGEDEDAEEEAGPDLRCRSVEVERGAKGVGKMARMKEVR